MSRPLPPTASVAEPAGGARLYAPSADRNVGPIADLLAQVAPATGRALEIASGTGQHVIVFADRLPGLHWQPTDPQADRRASIDAYAADAGLPNIRPAQPLDACAPGWADTLGHNDLIVLCNLLHLISWPEVQALLAEAAKALAPGGTFVIYGPFKRGGELTSEGDRTFDAQLRASDPAIGYKDDFDTLDLLVSHGLDVAQVVEMPANNLALIATRP
ncbi:MAG: methyltransferase [Rhodobacteraceae bacterium]|nr:methyltransferase [Paracoccaceae bacterium]MAY44809.1 methyltransferase [Paracoccaceae bacterium]